LNPKRQPRWPLVGLSAVLIGVAFMWLSGRNEPVYKGRRVSAWILDLADNNPSLTRFFEETPAKEAVRAIGTNAIPFLAKAIGRQKGFFDCQTWETVRRKLPDGLQRRSPHPYRVILSRREAARMLAEFASI